MDPSICAILSCVNATRSGYGVNAPGLNEIRIFVAAAQAGTLAAASRDLRLPSSTLSRALTRLEKQLGVLLVQRGPKGLLLTDSGKEYLQFCRQALQTLSEGADVLTGHRSGPTGRIRVACPVTMAIHVIAPLLKDFVERFPHLHIQIEPYSSHYDQEPREDVDVFFKLRAPRDSLRRMRSYPGSARALFASSAYVYRYGSPNTPDELIEHRCIGSGRWTLVRGKESATPNVTLRIVSDDPMINLRAAMDGLGIAILPLWVARPQEALQCLVPILPQWQPEPITLCALFFGRSSLTPKVRLFLDFLSEYVGTERDPRIQGRDAGECFTDPSLPPTAGP